jgi:mRNA interferase RelE/StbE
MGFKLEFENASNKSLKRLERLDYLRIKRKIEEIQDNPFLFGSIKLQGTSFGKNCYRVRVGDFRIIYDVDLERKIILVVRIERRENAYVVRESSREYETNLSTF